ncbi:Nn.00g107270.m01.CDS01 [Neocucurbitaria sp. VM-36]
MLDFDFHLTTPRLYISHLNPSNSAHCDFICELINSPEFMNESKSIELKMPNREAGRKFIQDGIPKMERSGHGRYLISLKPLDISIEYPTTKEDALPFSRRRYEPIGVVTMQLARFPGAPTIPDVGFGLLARHQGRGYATEAAQRLLKYFEEERGQRDLAGYTSPENEASKNVFRRLGFEERGVRRLFGILGEGEEKVLKALVWTKGIGEGDGELEKWGM